MRSEPMRSPYPAMIAGERAVRIMVVDDSAVVRGVVAHWVGQAAGFDLVAAAPNGRIALDLLAEAEPDIVLLDLDMPELDGLATLPLLLARRPGLSVIVVSTLTQRNAVISLRCLASGAVDYLPKPSTQHEAATSLDFRRELIGRLEGLAGPYRASVRAHTASRPSNAAERLPAPPAPRADAPRPRCLLIGASTGGPRAVVKLAKGLERVAERVPILVVQHMPPIFTAVFAEQVTSETGLSAREAQHGEQ